jgi:hypothetical protein
VSSSSWQTFAGLPVADGFDQPESFSNYHGVFVDQWYRTKKLGNTLAAKEFLVRHPPFGGVSIATALGAGVLIINRAHWDDTYLSQLDDSR